MKRSIELRQERRKLWEEAQKLLPQGNARMSAEDNAKFDQIMADVDARKAEIDRLERAEALEVEMNSAIEMQGGARSQPGGNPSANRPDEERQKLYRDAHMRYLRRGIHGISSEDRNLLSSVGRSAEYRDLDNTVGASGGFLVPTGFQRELDVALKSYSGVRQAARIVTTASGNQLPWPTTNDTTVVGTFLGANAVATAATESDQAFGHVLFNAYTATSGVVRVPNELMQDSAFDLEGELRDRFAERLGRCVENAYTNNTAAGAPLGFLPQITLGTQGAAGETTSMIYDDVINLIHSVDPAYRPQSGFMFYDGTLAMIRKIKDNYGRPLFGPGLNGEEPDKLADYPFYINQFMPAPAASAKTVAFGPWKKYVVRDVQGMVVVRLNELYALNNEVGFVAFMRTDGNLVDAGTHPIKYFEQSAA